MSVTHTEEKPETEKTVHELIKEKAQMETLDYQLESLKKDEEEKQNFMTKLYENENFRKEKEQNEQ